MANPTAFRPQRPPVMGRRHMVVSGHYWASQAGFQILEAGGNAVDAGVATGIAINVLECEYTSFGGVAPVIVYLPGENKLVTLGGVGPWPKAATLDYFQRHHGGRVPDGILNSVVPSAAGIWVRALERYGTMSFGEVAKAAIRFARQGFPAYPFLVNVIKREQKKIAGWPSTAAIYLPNGRPPEVGETLVQTDLARTLQYMVDEEAAHAKKGRQAGLKAAYDAFYRGDIAARIVAQQKDMGGLLAAEDLAAYEPDIETPPRVRFGDYDVYCCGPWCQGPLVLSALNILDGVDLKGMAHNGPDYVHAVTEALKLAAADREVYFGDPKFVDVPLDELLSKDYAAKRRAMIRPDQAWPDMPPAGAVRGREAPRWSPDPTAMPEPTPKARLATSFFCVIDDKGNTFAATPSDGTLGAPVVPGTGIITSQWGSRAYTNPKHPAALGPGRRPRMSSNPGIAIRKGRTVIPFGSPGSEVLGQAMMQAFLNTAVFGMDAQSAVEAPRFASYSWPASPIPHAYNPGVLKVEAPVGEVTAAALKAKGHKVEMWPEREPAAGSVCMIVHDLESGVMSGGADPRRTAYAIGW